MNKQEQFNKLLQELFKVSGTNNFLNLHIVIEDLNLQEGFINSAKYESEKVIEICNLLLSVSEQERRNIIENYFNNQD